MFSTPRNSIFQNTRLKPPTTGRIISSAHCGNIEGPTGGAPFLFALDVPLMFKPLILQRPFLIDELDMKPRNAIGSGVARTNGCIRRDAILLAAQTNEPASLKIERGEERRAMRTDIFRDRLFRRDDDTFFVNELKPHVDGDAVTRFIAVILESSRMHDLFAG